MSATCIAVGRWPATASQPTITWMVDPYAAGVTAFWSGSGPGARTSEALRQWVAGFLAARAEQMLEYVESGRTPHQWELK